MGMIQARETHGKRSSSMTFAMRWKHENLRLIVLSAIISIAMTFMFLVLLYGSADKSVSVVVNGQETVVKTKQWVLQRLLDEQAITVGPYDEVSHPLNASIKDGDRIEIKYAVPVTVKADGKTSTVYTTEKTVQAAIGKLNIPVRDQDKVSPSLATTISDAMTVTVTRVDTKVAETERTLPFSIVKKQDPTLEQGKEKLVQSGKNGLVIERVEKKYENGVLVSSKLVDKVVQKHTVSQVVAIGSKKNVHTLSAASNASFTKSGVTFKAKKVLKNVTLTAYSAGVASTGKNEDHPGYGITASGAKVKEGRTIAVDPDVIPIGWWVYIEGIGFRRAEDTGSAINGNKIDVYFDSTSYANKFGRKKGYTVYVLGPTKPSAS
ncbi:ubiquitin-like domain-containing protein [Paenibacillus glycanilyticus]|uniref:ubiquitin-like domain-containing protein n=1 Tax=Paenibacillus glycanilyticus TaxID=126569 RepID=UPI00203A85A1|nr:3D domain-containing protein [Paenibacillus glycanilyticus]MCM3631301.1 ubiquitin-like domain-containing protein [Paenibacillus glycanilyticus]